MHGSTEGKKVTRVDVAVVGAGPVGLALAAELRRLGVASVVVDKAVAGANTSRACVIHARTLEVLQEMGATRKLLEEGVKVPIFRIRDRDRSLVTIDFAEIDSAYPFTLMNPQDRTEAVLLEILEALGGTVDRPTEFLELEDVGAGVEVTVASNGEKKSISARWLVGCDGMHSSVREQAGIAFEGAVYEQGFVLADVQMTWPLSREEVSLFYSPRGLVVVAPLPGDRFRIVATDDDAPADPSLEYIQSLLEERGPTDSHCEVHDMAWSSRFRIHHRVSTAPRKGHVLLCGDSAHVHSPAGGQGMNTGIQDAISLADVLARTLRTGDEAPLDRWARERHEVARRVVETTDRMTRLATVKAPWAQSLRNAAVSFAGHLPPVRDAVARRLSEIDLR
jgi:2-polyprenyl-6-methoxyphenol hydroxylase-like FAD-dependent oxidoreductase